MNGKMGKISNMRHFLSRVNSEIEQLVEEIGEARAGKQLREQKTQLARDGKQSHFIAQYLEKVNQLIINDLNDTKTKTKKTNGSDSQHGQTRRCSYRAPCHLNGDRPQLQGRNHTSSADSEDTMGTPHLGGHEQGRSCS